MKLVKLQVEQFQAIHSAEVEFGPGLNVLFGPNDLGKSSLAWALRAVLLLQHNAAAHERFVSWYGGQNPTVALTFTDGSGGHWRVTKVFGGSGGRSLLESSRDGRTFRTDVTGRQVDEKLRSMLGWGIAAPGGSGGTRGIPESFLAHVLLAEQDSVRKVLFESSLENDNDDAGRVKLVEALGALAQDPLFKSVLDEAQSNADRAFTAKGARRRAADSPFVAIGNRIKELQKEKSDLEARIRETEAAEHRVRIALAQQGDASVACEEAKERSTRLSAQQQLAQKQSAARAEIVALRARLAEVATITQQRADMQAALIELSQRSIAAATAVSDAKTAVANAEARRRQASQDLTALADARGDGEQQRLQLELQQKTAQQELSDASRQEERSREALQVAEQIASDVRAALLEHARAKAAASAAAQRREEALVPLSKAKVDLEAAKEALRTATSADAARARELRRSEITNSQLVRKGDRERLEAQLRSARHVRELEKKAADASSGQKQLDQQLATARTSLDALRQAMAAADARARRLVQIEQFAQLQDARASLATAERAMADAAALDARVTELASQAATLRSSLRANLPSTAELAELRQLREALRLAEARLGGGLSVTVTPKRALAIRTRVDGGTPIEQSSAVSLAASRRLELEIDDLVSIEVVAGEESARDAERGARASWETKGAPALAAFGVSELEELEALRRTADATNLELERLDREQQHATERAAQLRASTNHEALAQRVGELDVALRDEDLAALASDLAALGTNWSDRIRREQETARATATKSSTESDSLGTTITRLEVQADNARAGASSLEQELATQQALLGAPATDVEARAATELESIAGELEKLERELTRLSGAADDQEQRAKKQVLFMETAVAAAEARLKQADDDNATERDKAVQAGSRLESAQHHAARHDTELVWQESLADDRELSVAPWRQSLEKAERRLEHCRTAFATLDSQLKELATARERALEAAKEAVGAAEAAVVAAQEQETTAAATQQTTEKDITAKRVAIAEADTLLAKADAEGAQRALATRESELAALGPTVAEVTAEQLAANADQLRRHELNLRDLDEQLAQARGALQHVGGAIVRERLEETNAAIEAATQHEAEVIAEFEGWRLLVDTLHQSEATQGAHLGRALAAPVSARFKSLTGGRYGQLDLGPHLNAEGITVSGETRKISALSAGTQDQLATLLRLCVAEQLRSSIILDDHLSQSDPERVEWFNTILRSAAQQIQVVLITCRPREVLSAEEFPAAEHSRTGAAGLLRAVDLARIIRRLGEASAP